MFCGSLEPTFEMLFIWTSAYKWLNTIQSRFRYHYLPHFTIRMWTSEYWNLFDRISRADEACVNRLNRNVLLQFHFLGGHFIISANIDVWSAGINVFSSLHQRWCDDPKPIETLNGAETTGAAPQLPYICLRWHLFSFAVSTIDDEIAQSV
jgi:hypothetical protein